MKLEQMKQSVEKAKKEHEKALNKIIKNIPVPLLLAMESTPQLTGDGLVESICSLGFPMEFATTLVAVYSYGKAGYWLKQMEMNLEKQAEDIRRN